LVKHMVKILIPIAPNRAKKGLLHSTMCSVVHVFFLSFTLVSGAALTANSSKHVIGISSDGSLGASGQNPGDTGGDDENPHDGGAGSCSGGKVEEYVIQVDANGQRGNWCEETCVDPNADAKVASALGGTRGSCPSQGYTLRKGGIMKQGIYVSTASHADLPPASGNFEEGADCDAHHVERHGICEMFCTHSDSPLNAFLHSRTNMKEGRCEDNGYPTFEAEVHLIGYVKAGEEQQALLETRHDISSLHNGERASRANSNVGRESARLIRAEGR